MKTQHVVMTRPSAGAAERSTNLTLDWADASDELIRTLASQSLIIKLQGAWRKKGIPTTATFRVADAAVRSVVRESPEDRARRDPAYRARLMAELMAMNESAE